MHSDDVQKILVVLYMQTVPVKAAPQVKEPTHLPPPVSFNWLTLHLSHSVRVKRNGFECRVAAGWIPGNV